MRVLAVVIVSLLLSIPITNACSGEPFQLPQSSASEQNLVGRVLLPPGSGSRGVEVVLTVSKAGGEPQQRWVLFDDEGRFSASFNGTISRVIVSTGLRSEVHRIEADDLPEVNAAGQVELGVIDLRERLTRHRLKLEVAEVPRLET